MAFYYRCIEDYGYASESGIFMRSAHEHFQASIPSFRNAVLEQKPVLLETFITNAIDSKSGFDKVYHRH